MTVPIPLKKHQREIQNINLDEHFIFYNIEIWATKFGDDPDFQYLNQSYPNGISRGQVTQLVQNIAVRDFEFSQLRKSFLAAMMWGYGTTGYGPHRTRIMLDSPNVESVLTDTYYLLKEGKVVEAYQQFRVKRVNLIKRCGPAFFTKFFYFAGLGLKLKLLPLILDSRVEGSLSHTDMMGKNISEIAALIDGSAKGYQKYIILMDEWAKELECRPDAIEYFLFNWTGN